MRQASKRIPESAEKTVRDIRRATRRHHSAEEKIRIVRVRLPWSIASSKALNPPTCRSSSRRASCSCSI